MQISPWPVSGERVRVRITSPKFPIALIQVYIYKYACASISTRSLDADTVAPFSSFLLFAVFFFDGKLKRGTKAKNENGRRKGNLLIHPFSTRPPARVCVCVWWCAPEEEDLRANPASCVHARFVDAADAAAHRCTLGRISIGAIYRTI